MLPKMMKWKKGKDNFALEKKQPIEGLPIDLIGKYSFAKLRKTWLTEKKKKKKLPICK